MSASAVHDFFRVIAHLSFHIARSLPAAFIILETQSKSSGNFFKMAVKFFAFSLLGCAIAQTSTLSQTLATSQTSMAWPSESLISLTTKTFTGQASTITFPAVLFPTEHFRNYTLHASAVSAAPQATTIVIGCGNDDTNDDSNDDSHCPFDENQTFIYGPSTYASAVSYQYTASDYGDSNTDIWGTTYSLACTIVSSKATCQESAAGKAYNYKATMTVESAGIAPLTVIVTDGVDKLKPTGSAGNSKSGNAAASNVVKTGYGILSIVASLLGASLL